MNRRKEQLINKTQIIHKKEQQILNGKTTNKRNTTNNNQTKNNKTTNNKQNDKQQIINKTNRTDNIHKKQHILNKKQQI